MGQISREQFEAYESIKKKGYVNMFYISTIIKLANDMFGVDLTKEEVFEIMKNYNKYEKKYE